MRFDPRKSFGHPVLRNYSDDYIEASIQSSVELVSTEDANEFELDYHVMVGVSELKKALKNQDVCLVISLACTKTLYSQTFVTYELAGSRLIDMRDIRGDLNISVEMIASKTPFVIKSTKFHSEYGGGSGSYTLSKGDLVAQAEPLRVFIEKEVFQSVISLFEWSVNEETPNDEWRLDWDEGGIKIITSAKQREQLAIAENTPEGRAILLNSIFLPAMIALISSIIEGEADEDFLWVKTIHTKLNSQGVTSITDQSNAVELAQKVLKTPLSALNRTIFQVA